MSHKALPQFKGRKLTIWQQNINKSLKGQLDLLHRLKPKRYDIALIQEPYFDQGGKSRANRHWVSIVPPSHTPHQRLTRSLILINTRLPSVTWTAIPLPSPDITAMQIFGDFGTIRIINIYNDGAHNDTL
ncbi:hypothetical protein C8R44DRAFT_620697, partial [Mycena epipterygia]